jgi:hypothetical protein
VFLQIPPAPLAPDTDRLFFFSRYIQAGEIMIANQFVPQVVILVINVFIHNEILRCHIFAHTSQFSGYHTFLYPVALVFALMSSQGGSKTV